MSTGVTVSEWFNSGLRRLGIGSASLGQADSTRLASDTDDGHSNSNSMRESDAYVPGGSSNRGESDGYTELMGGSVPCPSCQGSGRIPHSLESQLVALIPVNDKRLKPRRTWMWVSAGMIFVLLVVGFIIFFLLPRAVDVTNPHGRKPIQEVVIVDYKKGRMIKLMFNDDVGVTNNNYYAVKVSNASASIINHFQPYMSDKIGTGGNSSGVWISPRTDGQTVAVNNTITITNKETIQYCESWFDLFPMYVLMEFDVTVTFEYFGHREQDTLTYQRQVCCVPDGNCTKTVESKWS